MNHIKCDVLVIGGGPAGSSVAEETAKRGLHTILIEEDEEIGKPIQCAEGIGSYLFPLLPFSIPKELLLHSNKGMILHGEDAVTVKEGGYWLGSVINREQFDKWLSQRAVDAGAEIMLNTRFDSFEVQNKKYQVSKVFATQNGNKICFIPTYIIGADGVNSTVVKNLGIQTDKDIIGEVKSYEYTNVVLNHDNYYQIFFGDFAPGGYGYIFPISKTRANVGIAVTYNKEHIEEFFQDFINHPKIKEQLQNAKRVIEKSGDAPIRSSIKKWQYGNVYLVGDSVNQNIKPFVEGILPAIICGNILGKHLPLSNTKYKRLIHKNLDNMFKESEYITKEILKVRQLPKELINLSMMALFTDTVHRCKDLKKKSRDELKTMIENS